MRSLIIIEVEHGEDTDGLDTFAVLACGLTEYADGLEDVNVINHEFTVDLPEHITARAVSGILSS